MQTSLKTPASPTTAPSTTMPDCVLPHPDIQKFLLEVLAQAQFPGSMSEFVSGVKQLLQAAYIKPAA